LCASYWNYLGEQEKALNHLSQVERSTMSEDLVSLSWATRGAIEEAAGNMAGARACWRTILDRFPHSPDALLARSKLGLSGSGERDSVDG
jgi:tetratricopeptide (TPR) repeat protein